MKELGRWQLLVAKMDIDKSFYCGISRLWAWDIKDSSGYVEREFVEIKNSMPHNFPHGERRDAVELALPCKGVYLLGKARLCMPHGLLRIANWFGMKIMFLNVPSDWEPKRLETQKMR